LLYDARAIANQFLELAKADAESLDPMKLLKPVYLAHGWNLPIKDEPLLRERIEAWPYGLVVPSALPQCGSTRVVS
jgi:uncharacterized phage-associated protein